MTTNMVEIFLIIACFLFMVYYFTIRDISSKSSLPKTHTRWPIIGDAWNVNMNRSHIVFSHWAKKLGPIFEVSFFNERFIVLNDYDTIYEALVENGAAVAGRPYMFRTAHAQRDRHSIVWQTYTKNLISLRKEVLKSLRLTGKGLENLEEKCLLEIEDLIGIFKSFKGQPFDPEDAIYCSVCSVMLTLLTGRRFLKESGVFKHLQELSVTFNKTFGSGNGRYVDYIPLIHRKVLAKALRMRDRFWNQYVDCEQVTEDSVVGHLQKAMMSSSKDNSSVIYSSIKECFTNLILAGTDTTATTISCLLLVLLHRGDVQEKLHREIDIVIGGDTPSLSHKPLLPYMEAVLMEILRYISHVPLAIPHCTIEDTRIGGYKIPKNTTVYVNLWALHHDPVIWPDPWTFDPSRFLDGDGKLVPPTHVNRKRLMAFGAGRRVCIGEILAKNRLFLFVTSLLQTFKFEACNNLALPSLDPRTFDLGIVLHPKPFQLRAILRQRRQ